MTKLPVIKTLYLFLFVGLFGQSPVYGTSIKDCDSLIKLGVDLMLHKNHVKSLELLSEARMIAEKNKWFSQVFLAQNNIGNNYYMLLDYGEALKLYYESYAIARKYLDAKHEMIVLNNIAILYSKERKFDKANEYFYKSYSLAKQFNDSLKIGLYGMNLGNLANEENKLQRARHYLTESLRFTERLEVQIPAQIGLCNNDLLSGHLQQARVNGLKLLPKLQHNDNNDNRVALTTIIAKTYLQENNLAAALQWTNNTIEEKPDLESRVELYRMFSDIYFRLKSYDLAFQYKDSIAVADAELNALKNGKLFESNEVKFQVQQYKEKILENESRRIFERKIFFSVLAVIILGIIILLLLFRNQLIKNKQKEQLMIQEQKLTALKLEKEMFENSLLLTKERTALLEQGRLKNEIALRNQKILSKALYLSGRNELLQEVLKSLSAIPKLSENAVIIKDIKALKDHLKTADDWENYVRHFDEVNHDFIKKLTHKHPDLTITDLRYISYVYMNLDTKEIATMLNITPAACRKRKERVEKRLALPEQNSLHAYLMSI